jgi:hypothetical protein
VILDEALLELSPHSRILFLIALVWLKTRFSLFVAERVQVGQANP